MHRPLVFLVALAIPVLAYAAAPPVAVTAVDSSGDPVRVQATGTALDVNIASGTTTPPTGASSTQVQGTAATDAPVVGSPVQAGGRASSAVPSSVSTDGDAAPLWLTTGGATVIGGVSITIADALSNNALGLSPTNNGAARGLIGFPHVFNGTTWDRPRTAGIGNGVASTGIAAAAPYGEYLTNANQVVLTTGQYSSVMLDPAGNLRTAPQRPTAGDVLAANASVTSTTASTALITVSAGRTWVGTVCLSVAGSKAGAATGNGEVLASILTAGTNVVPAAGTYFEVDTAIGANVVAGTVGTNGANANCTQFTAVAPAGNTITVNYAATCTSTTACRVSASANGVMQ